MEKYIVNDIKVLHPSILWVLIGAFISISILSIEENSIKYLLIKFIPFLLCSIPYIITFFTYKKIKIENDQMIISNTFYKIKTFQTYDIKNIKILVLNNFPVAHGAKVNGRRMQSSLGEIENINIVLLLIYSKDDKIIFKYKINKNKYFEKIIDEKIGYNYSGVMEFKLYSGSIELNNVHIFSGNEEANNYWMKVN
jgi:hypothetical protein